MGMAYLASQNSESIAPSWSSYFECNDTVAPSDCFCPDSLVKIEKDGVFNCEQYIDPDEFPQEEVEVIVTPPPAQPMQP